MMKLSERIIEAYENNEAYGMARQFADEVAQLEAQREEWASKALELNERRIQLEAENERLRGALRHANYRTHKPRPDACSACEEVDALLDGGDE